MSVERQSNPISGLTIALQVMGHDCLKLIVPIITALVGIATISVLMYWSWGELQSFQPDLSASRQAPPAQRIAVVPAKPQVERPVYRNFNPVKKKTKRPMQIAARPVRRPSSDDCEYYGYVPDNPTGGRIVKSDSLCTEYSWDK